MATRASEADVKAIIDTGLTPEEVTPFLRIANMMVTRLLLNSGYDDEYLAEIEAWWAAHFVAVRDPRLSEESVDDASWKFDGKVGMEGLNATRYGQQVLLLDYAGVLETVSSSEGSGTFEVF